MKPVYVRSYIENPGMAYDPAPLEDLDIPECLSVPCVGDVLYSGRNVNEYYRVTERHFDVSTDRCALMVEQIEPVGPYTKYR